MNMRALVLLSALVIPACSGGAGSVNPAPKAEASLTRFLQAAADSDLTVMAATWGTSRGPAAETNNPSDYQKRIVIMQSYLRGYAFRVVANEAGNQGNQRVLSVELSKSGCLKVVPFTMVRASQDRWLVFRFDLDRVGNPSTSCTNPGSGS
ncbi:MAG: hypothetical protein AB7I33_00900 [Gemmatimonadales bacterium]